MSFDWSELDFDIPDEEETPKRDFDKPIYTVDAETLKFLHGRFPVPFVFGIWDGATFRHTWGKNCIDDLIELLTKLPPGTIYMHNGGRFDLFYFMRVIFGRKCLIINNRVVRAYMPCDGGFHEIRDSYAIMPFPLAAYKKDEIDYDKFEEHVRDFYKDEILDYLKGDCIYLHDLCTAFIKMFGPKLTVGSAGIKELKKVHTFEPLGEMTDEDIRSRYFYGGRVEFFKQGILHGNWKVYDVNSMYPAVMRNYEHPIEMPEIHTQKIRSTTCFVTAEGKNYGAFPKRTKDGLRFDIEDGIFSVTIHEWNTAMRLCLFEPRKIIRCDNFRRRGTFAEFVDKFHGLRKAAKDSGDDIGSLLYKYALNSTYGKFAQNNKNLFEYIIDGPMSNYLEYYPEGHERAGAICDDSWIPASVPIDSIVHSSLADIDYIMWKKPAQPFSRYNVATGASITGAARSILMEAIAKADTPIYCDTDSIICKNLDGVEIDPSKLGAWKLEARAHTAMIARRKLYALMGDDCPGCECPKDAAGMSKGKPCKHNFHKTGCVKLASKGVKITHEDIRDVCLGKTVTYKRDAPSFKFDGSHQFITRRIRL